MYEEKCILIFNYTPDALDDLMVLNFIIRNFFKLKFSHRSASQMPCPLLHSLETFLEDLIRVLARRKTSLSIIHVINYFNDIAI